MRDKELLLQNALDLIKKYNVTAYELGNNLGIAVTGVQKIIDGKTKRPQLYTLDAIISYITNKYENEGILQSGIVSIDKDKPKDSVTPQPYDGYMEVEFTDLSTAAGKLGGNSLTELPRSRKMLVPKEFDNGNYLVVRVEGDSMDNDSKGSIPNGTDILIKEYFLQNGDKLPIKNNLFVIVSREGTVLKKITEHNIEKGFLLCHSYNSSYKDYEIPLEDVLQIFIFRKIVGFRPPILD